MGGRGGAGLRRLCGGGSRKGARTRVSPRVREEGAQRRVRPNLEGSSGLGNQKLRRLETRGGADGKGNGPLPRKESSGAGAAQTSG